MIHTINSTFLGFSSKRKTVNFFERILYQSTIEDICVDLNEIPKGVHYLLLLCRRLFWLWVRWDILFHRIYSYRFGWLWLNVWISIKYLVLCLKVWSWQNKNETIKWHYYHRFSNICDNDVFQLQRSTMEWKWLGLGLIY